MNLEQIETIIAKNLTITDQRLMDGVIGAVLDAVAAECEACERLVWDTPEPDDEYVSHREAIAAAIRARGEI